MNPEQQARLKKLAEALDDAVTELQNAIAGGDLSATEEAFGTCRDTLEYLNDVLEGIE